MAIESDISKKKYDADINMLEKQIGFAEGAAGLAVDYYDFKKQDKNYACFDPFAEIVVAYDGKILLCCLDFNAKFYRSYKSFKIL